MAIYLDYQATTPLAPEAREAMLRWLGPPANPHAAHAGGRAAAAAVAVARDQVGALLPSGGRLIFTAGATEAINLAMLAAQGGAVAASAIEHAAVLDSAHARGAVRAVPVGPDGIVDLPALEVQARGAALVALMLVNNEIGTVQPVAEAAAIAHAAGALLLCDAVQGYGRMAVPEGPDMIALSAHKIYGPVGIGALWLRDGIDLPALIHGGGQQEGLRSGTLSPALAAGFGAAAALAAERMAADAAHVERLWSIARAALPGWTLNGSAERRYHGNLNLRRDGVDAARLLSDCRDVQFSLGSACASGSGRPSHVLKAIGLSDGQARSSIRLGFGRYTSETELRDALARIDAAAEAQLASRA
jgi:cysteine desulfurase